MGVCHSIFRAPPGLLLLLVAVAIAVAVAVVAVRGGDGGRPPQIV